MRLKILLEAETPLIVPWDYRTALTAAVYDILSVSDKDFSSWLHDKGYQSGKRKYRLFVYSNLRPLHFQPTDAGLQTNGNCTWEIAAPGETFLEKFVDGLLKRDRSLQLFGVDFRILDFVKMQLPAVAPTRTWKTISPIVVSTWDGKSRQPRYRNGTEPEFVQALEANLLSKWEAFNGKKWEGENLNIRVWSPKSTLVPVFNINVRGWYLRLQMWGPPELIRFAYDAGLGEKNSQGFGMIDIGG
jgi:CRISPR-associated endoribonuclease Cas6